MIGTAVCSTSPLTPRSRVELLRDDELPAAGISPPH